MDGHRSVFRNPQGNRGCGPSDHNYCAGRMCVPDPVDPDSVPVVFHTGGPLHRVSGLLVRDRYCAADLLQKEKQDRFRAGNTGIKPGLSYI